MVVGIVVGGHRGYGGPDISGEAMSRCSSEGGVMSKCREINHSDEDGDGDGGVSPHTRRRARDTKPYNESTNMPSGSRPGVSCTLAYAV